MNKRRVVLPPVLRHTFILVALVLGLLAMHILGIDHQMPHGAHGSQGALTNQAGNQHSPQDLTAVAASMQHTSADDSPAFLAVDSLGAAESAMIGMCVLALSIGGLFIHLFSRAFRPVPGRGLAAPPVIWFPQSRPHTTPSLIQLSISRT
ncbi:DUF6153 family protein [Paeniglutamicibacter cryotolerans]|uniref:Uncharacterized protein n=1 Tax=Paeniglutamicibacter cryotolerans TaxID=670079 RepID=A0A839QMH1_9MICC|nr:DUF6153 family protein [Paeniglutamicibacter cryotolerans]MBB2997628.1 hypothetical protein [Paeniglutamicibacter cryotolerans]